MRLRNIRLFAMAIATVLIATSCGGTGNSPQSASPDADCRVIKHEAGKTEVCGQPENVVVLGPNVLELLLALGVQPAGFADQMAFHQGKYDNPSQQIPYLGDRVKSQPANVGLTYTPSIEAILNTQPDLIVGSQWLEKEYGNLSEIAPTLLLEWFDVEGNLQAIAQALGRPELAEGAIAKRQEKIANARKKLAPAVKTNPKVLMLTASNLQEMVLITEGNSFCGSLMKDLGFELIYPPGIDRQDANLRPPLSLEVLPQFNEADSAIVLGYNFKDSSQLEGMEDFQERQLSGIEKSWQENAIAQSLDASKAGRVYFIPAYLCLGLPGPIGTELYLKELETQLLPSQ
ncbi:iron-siderophore ABC transporter substrate-binding protein [Lusitaniella coriacea LEGE 07157]|uniref:Iron-siderophore ABC transporter substrate-binding protein n=2 Tax=Lusitaniella TaxID=1983104 RepID=A0A8J7JDM6_9CYAN|nr:iron-siderophore ABC transporter substrate-binding protein [Lusitaniella coriacea LEGE 07157]